MQHDLKGEHLSDNLTFSDKNQTWANQSEMGQLNRKLQQAAKHISQLAKDKQQLIEVNNRLRAELNRNGKTQGTLESGKAGKLYIYRSLPRNCKQLGTRTGANQDCC